PAHGARRDAHGARHLAHDPGGDGCALARGARGVHRARHHRVCAGVPGDTPAVRGPTEPPAHRRSDPRPRVNASTGGTAAVVWFRRDLRTHDHPALQHALEHADRVLPLYVVDPALLHGRWRSPNRVWHLARSLERLDEMLQERGARLTIVR